MRQPSLTAAEGFPDCVCYRGYGSRLIISARTASCNSWRSSAKVTTAGGTVATATDGCLPTCWRPRCMASRSGPAPRQKLHNNTGSPAGRLTEIIEAHPAMRTDFIGLFLTLTRTSQTEQYVRDRDCATDIKPCSTAQVSHRCSFFTSLFSIWVKCTVAGFWPQDSHIIDWRLLYHSIGVPWSAAKT